MTHGKKLIQLGIILFLVLLLSPRAYAGSLNVLKDKKNETDGLIEVKQEKIQELKVAQSNLYRDLENLDNQITQVQGEVVLLESQIEELTQRIIETEQEIESLKISINSSIEKFSDRLRAMYVNGEVGFLQVLLSSKDANDFLSRSTLMQSIAEYDRKIIEEFKNNKTLMEAKELELNGQKTSLEVAKASLLGKKEELESTYSSKNSLLNGLIDNQDSLEIEVTDLQKYSKELDSEIQSKIEEARRLEEARKQKEAEAQKAAAKSKAEKSSQSTGTKKQKSNLSASSNDITYVGSGGFIWPTPSSYRITSNFGYRIHPISGAAHSHTGIDIGAGYGASILAVDSGTVTLACYNGSYGNCVIISHGNGLVSLYAHCSSLNVSVGERVSAGEVVGYIGSTGNSTGPHLHFEVRKNGVRQNPLNYL